MGSFTDLFLCIIIIAIIVVCIDRLLAIIFK